MSLYDEDFVAWTRQQANLLRSMPDSTDIDIANLVDEIEGLGRTAVSELEAALRRVLVGLVDLNREPSSVDVELIYSAQSDAIIRADGGVWRHIDLAKPWMLAVRSIRGFPEQCPYKIEYLLAEDFDVSKAVALLRS